MRISDWSSDVCSSDLLDELVAQFQVGDRGRLDPALVEGGGVRRQEGGGRPVERFAQIEREGPAGEQRAEIGLVFRRRGFEIALRAEDRKSTRLNSSH